MNVFTQPLPGHPRDRIGREGPAQIHPVGVAVPDDIFRESSGYDGGCRYAVLTFHDAGKLGDTRRTAVSAANPEDNAVRFFLKFGPEFRTVHESVAAFKLDHCFHGGHVFPEP